MPGDGACVACSGETPFRCAADVDCAIEAAPAVGAGYPRSYGFSCVMEVCRAPTGAAPHAPGDHDTMAPCQRDDA